MGGFDFHVFHSIAPLVGFEYREFLSEYHDVAHGCLHRQLRLKPKRASLVIKIFRKLTLFPSQ